MLGYKKLKLPNLLIQQKNIFSHGPKWPDIKALFDSISEQKNRGLTGCPVIRRAVIFADLLTILPDNSPTRYPPRMAHYRVT